MFLTGWGAFALEYVHGTEQAFISEVTLRALAVFALAVLTFPLGAAGFLPAALLMASGYVSGWEAIVIATPLVAVLGYLQWFRIFPMLYRRNIGIF